MDFVTFFLVLWGIGATLGLIYVLFVGVVPFMLTIVSTIITIPLAWGRAIWEGIQDAMAEPLPLKPRPQRREERSK